jgi:hypothetical protein
MRGPFEKFVDWRQCAAVMQREAVTRPGHRLSRSTPTDDSRSRDSSAVQRWATGWIIGGSSPGRDW